MRPRISKNLPSPTPKVREGMDKDHLAMVRKLPCCVCHPEFRTLFAIQPHHLLRTGEHGTGRKSSDRWAVPLCVGHHSDLHYNGDEEAFLTNYGIDGRALASALWACRNDDDPLAAMERVVFRFRQAAQQKRGVG